jgi:3-hydroxyisobutyrate dehydrogenase-like beta-hydroxyacid dehydrogenase
MRLFVFLRASVVKCPICQRFHMQIGKIRSERELSPYTPLQRDTHMRVGLIGLGHMGRGMALSLLKAGHEVTVYNRTRSKAEALAGDGAKVAGEVADACSGDAVITMLADDSAVEAVALGEGGILANLGAGALHVSSSTISVDLSERLSREHRSKGQRYVSAPVLGRPDRAAEGELFVLAAGSTAALRDAQPLFDAIGRGTKIIGEEPEKANLAKLGINFLIATVFESLGEAIALVDRGGVDKHAFLDLLTSTLFSAPIYKTYGPLVAADEPPPVGFAAPLGFKDIRLALAASDKLDVEMPFAGVLRDRFVELLELGGQDQDWSAVGRMAFRHADAVAAE